MRRVYSAAVRGHILGRGIETVNAHHRSPTEVLLFDITSTSRRCNLLPGCHCKCDAGAIAPAKGAAVVAGKRAVRLYVSDYIAV